MDILIVSHEYPPIGGGGANACMYLAKEYAKKGHNVDIVTVWYEGLPEKDIIGEYKGTINIYRTKAKRTKKESCSFGEMFDYILKARPICDRLIGEKASIGEKYDICQVFFGIPSGPVGLYLKRKYNIPYVIRFGGGDIPGFQDRFAIVYKVLGPFIKMIWKNADALVANSSGLKELAEHFCDKYEIEVYPNGVDTDVFYPNEEKIFDDTVELLFISRLIERKGLQYIIPKLQLIEKESGKQLHFTIVGDGPYREHLEQLTLENELTEKISFVGQKDKSELLRYYQKGDIFVFPSKKEGMPNAVLEAMASGLPIVMSPCQGSKELIDGNGIISNENLDDFYKALISVLQNDNTDLQLMSKRSRERAIECFSWAQVAKKYIQLFERIDVK